MALSYTITFMLTSKGFLESSKGDGEGVPCGCRGIAGDEETLSQWLELVGMYEGGGVGGGVGWLHPGGQSIAQIARNYFRVMEHVYCVCEQT